LDYVFSFRAFSIERFEHAVFLFRLFADSCAGIQNSQEGRKPLKSREF
jgi:hypothetical protein